MYGNYVHNTNTNTDTKLNIHIDWKISPHTPKITKKKRKKPQQHQNIVVFWLEEREEEEMGSLFLSFFDQKVCVFISYNINWYYCCCFLSW